MARLFDESKIRRAPNGRFRFKGFLAKMAEEAKKTDASKRESIKLSDGYELQAETTRDRQSGVTRKLYVVRKDGKHVGNYNTPEEAARAIATRSKLVQNEGDDLDEQRRELQKIEADLRLGRGNSKELRKRAAEIESDLRGKKSEQASDSAKGASPKLESSGDSKSEARKLRAQARRAEKQGNTAAAEAFRRQAKEALGGGGSTERSTRSSSSDESRARKRESPAPSGDRSSTTDHAKEARRLRAQARKAEKAGNETAAAAFRKQAAEALARSKGQDSPDDSRPSNLKAATDEYTRLVREKGPTHLDTLKASIREKALHRGVDPDKAVADWLKTDAGRKAQAARAKVEARRATANGDGGDTARKGAQAASGAPTGSTLDLGNGKSLKKGDKVGALRFEGVVDGKAVFTDLSSDDTQTGNSGRRANRIKRFTINSKNLKWMRKR